MIKEAVKKILNSFGIDIKRYRIGSDPLGWVKNYNIRTVIDVGANVGQFAREIRQRLPEAQIYSFEPINECYKKLNENMAGDNNFKALPFALGEHESIQNMNVSAYRPSSSLLPMADLHKEAFPYTKESTEQKVTVKTMDAISSELDLNENIMVKIDVQGYEEKVILGAKSVLARTKVVLLETSFYELYKGQPLFDQIYQLLRGLGFIYVGGIPGKKNYKTGETLFQDSIFIRQ